MKGALLSVKECLFLLTMISCSLSSVSIYYSILILYQLLSYLYHACTIHQIPYYPSYSYIDSSPSDFCSLLSLFSLLPMYYIFCPIINTVIFLQIHQSICTYYLLLQNYSRRKDSLVFS